MLACARLGSSPVQHDGGAGCEIVAGSVHLLAGLVQREPEADEARTDGQAEFQQEAEEEVVLGLWIRERQESDTGTSPAQPPRREPSEAAVQIRDVVLWTCPAGIVVLRDSLRDHDEIWLVWLMPWISFPRELGSHLSTRPQLRINMGTKQKRRKDEQFLSDGPPTFLGMEVKFFPVAMVMMELWGGLPRSEMLEKGKLVFTNTFRHHNCFLG